MNNNEYRDGGLFNDAEFDEMQKAKNYEIGFRLFRDYHFATLLFAIAFLNFSKGANLLLTVTSFLFLGTCFAVAIMYAAKTSAAGVMNIKYAKYMSKSSVLALAVVGIVVFSVLAVMCGLGITDDIFDISSSIMIIMVFAYMICFHIFARRNMKVLEKTLKDESEEE